MFSCGMVPCVIFEDEHLLAVHKPAGWNTHAPSPYTGEGIYDWLKQREPRWASLAIIHRLDKETSGVLVFGKTSLANRSLTDQFARRGVRKTYLLVTDREIPRQEVTAKSALLRVGEKYASRPGGESAETRFVPLSNPGTGLEHPGWKMMRAEPLTGRTHQIRVHAAELGFPILGDTLYGGTTAARVFLHAAEIAFLHPATQAPVQLSAPVDFETEPRQALRSAFIEREATNAFRLIHGASDGWADWQVDKLGGFLLSQSETLLSAPQQGELARLAGKLSSRGVYHKLLSRQVRRSTTAEASPQLVWGEAAPAPFEILENGVRYELSFNEGYSVGLFLDQRDNRRRLLTGQVGADFRLPNSDCRLGGTRSGQARDPRSEVRGQRSEVRNEQGEGGKHPVEILNVFAYTCGFSVCGAKAGARTTSLDLSKKYLEWGRRNFALNGLEPAAHEFIYGDAFDWLRRLAKKGRTFDVVVLDPPTFSQSKEQGVFRVEKNLGDLVVAALGVLKAGGVLLAAANTAGWPAEKFVASVEFAVRTGNRSIGHRHYVPQPPDYPVSRAEPAHLKTIWLQID
jgi:23S rRNA (cytosine1962-C5)-methyltransferase